MTKKHTTQVKIFCWIETLKKRDVWNVFMRSRKAEKWRRFWARHKSGNTKILFSARKRAQLGRPALKETPVLRQVNYAGIFTYGTDQKQAASLSSNLMGCDTFEWNSYISPTPLWSVGGNVEEWMQWRCSSLKALLWQRQAGPGGGCSNTSPTWKTNLPAQFTPHIWRDAA